MCSDSPCFFTYPNIITFVYCVSLDICLIFETFDQSSGVPTEVIKQKQKWENITIKYGEGEVPNLDNSEIMS